jgi:hypothetical protein
LYDGWTFYYHQRSNKMDAALKGMASELREALEMSSIPLDGHPALDGPDKPPSDRVFGEYQRRGGTEYTDPDEVVTALIEEVKNPS